jgi:hypothetical protein
MNDATRPRRVGVVMLAEGTDDDRVTRLLMEARRVVEGQCSDCGVRGWVLLSSRRFHGCHDRAMRRELFGVFHRGSPARARAVEQAG